MATARGVDTDIDRGTVEINELSIDDEKIVKFLDGFPEDEQTSVLEQCIRVGAATLELSETSKDIEYIKREFETMQSQVEQGLGNIEEEVDEKFGEDGVVADILDDHFGEDGERIQEVLRPNQDGSPLSTVIDEIEELEKQLIKEEGREEERQNTTLKGDDFEDDIDALLEDFVYRTNHDYLFTGEEIGDIADCRVGDFVLDLQTGQRIAIESKSEAGISQPEIKNQVETAIENRAADYGIFISECEDYVPNKIGYLREFDQEILVLALSADEEDDIDQRLFQIGLNWAQMRAIQSAVDAGETIDTEVIQDKVEEIDSEIDQFTEIKKQCGKIRSRANEIDELLETRKSEIQNELTDIRIELQGSD